MALELLRQSFVNRPLSEGEAANLAALATFAHHTPALRLLCAQFQQSCTELAFLWGQEPQSTQAWPTLEEAMYMQELHRLPSCFSHARRCFTPLEHRLVLNSTDTPTRQFAAAASVHTSVPELPVTLEDVGALCAEAQAIGASLYHHCLLYTSPSPRDRTRSRMPSSA